MFEDNQVFGLVADLGTMLLAERTDVKTRRQGVGLIGCWRNTIGCTSSERRGEEDVTGIEFGMMTDKTALLQERPFYHLRMQSFKMETLELF